MKYLRAPIRERMGPTRDSESAQAPIGRDGASATARKSPTIGPLHIKVRLGKSHAGSVLDLVKRSTDADLAIKDRHGQTPLASAASLGNTDAAIILVQKNPDMLYIPDDDDDLPIHNAAQRGKRDTVVYLRGVTKGTVSPYAYSGSMGFRLLNYVITAGFYDIALDFVRSYPDLATMELKGWQSPLTLMARKASAFPSGIHLNFWQHLIYSGIHVKLENSGSDPNTKGRDIENQRTFVLPKLYFKILEGIGYLVPRIKNEKLVHMQALQLVRSLCKAIVSSDHDTCFRRTSSALIEAAIWNIPEVVEEIMDVLPDAVLLRIEELFLFQIAVKHRSEKVFNLIYQMDESQRHHVLAVKDESGNNILHYAGQLAPPHKLKRVPSAALQMQRELQWFKEVEKLVRPLDKEHLNDAQKTPRMVFSEEHAGPVKTGENWLKDTANSCTIAATLIVTVAFAAAITVPGGNNDENGLPICLNQIAFKVFFVADSISLFAATTSLLMFLSILTARYMEQDFLLSLPNKLIVGIATLFLSTATMMISFTAAVYLTFGQRNRWILIPTSVLACFPVFSFVILQFPLLQDLFYSTHGKGIFGKRSNRSFFRVHG